MKHTRVVSLYARQAKPGVHLIDTTRVCFIVNEHTTQVFLLLSHMLIQKQKYIHLYDELCVWCHLKFGNQFCSLYPVDWRNLMKQSITVGAQLLWGGRYGCNNGRYGCAIVMSYIEINKAVSQWLLTFNLCVSVTWPLTCAFHIPCTHTPEIIDMHRGMCYICHGGVMEFNFSGPIWNVTMKLYLTEIWAKAATEDRPGKDKRYRFTINIEHWQRWSAASIHPSIHIYLRWRCCPCLIR